MIVEQARKLLVNYVILFQNWLGIRKLAFWGHGKNFQATSRNQFAEWIKRIVSTRVHWWFAYNDMSTRIVRELGFPEERITSVQNAIDTDFLSKALLDLKPADIEKIRSELNIISQNVGIYVGVTSFVLFLYHDLKFLYLSKIIKQGNRFRKEKKYIKAKKCFNKTIKIYPLFTTAWNNMGNVYFNEGKVNEAIRCYKKALAINPEYINAKKNLEVVIKRAGRS